MIEPDPEPLKWWQQARWLASLAGLIAAVSFAAFVITTVVTSDRTEETSDSVAAIQHAQEDIDVLVGFVEDLQNNDGNTEQQGQTAQAVQKILSAICATSDPVRIEWCKQEGIPTP